MHVSVPRQTLADAVLPRSGLLQNVVLILIFSLGTAISAQAAFHLPFTPVPITLQTLLVLLTGAVLGSRMGALTLIAYLGEGAVGLPVFAGGQSGLVYMAGPTGGYLVGFVAAAWLVGYLSERAWDRRLWRTAVAMVAGSLVIYLGGCAWLAVLTGRSLDGVLALGMYPFLIGDAYKIVVAAIALPGAWGLLGLVRRG